MKLHKTLRNRKQMHIVVFSTCLYATLDWCFPC